MKKISIKVLCTLFSVILIFSSSASLGTFAVDGDDTVETTVSSDVLEVEAYDSEDGAEDEIEIEMDEFSEGDEESPELSEEQAIEEMHLTNGISEFDLGTIEDNVPNPDYDSSHDELIVDTPMDNTMDEMSEESEPLEGDTETGFADPRFIASSTNVTVNKGCSSTIVLAYTAYSGTVKISGTRNNTNISGSFGNWYKSTGVMKKNLTIYGNYAGTSTITIKFYNSKNQVLRNISIKVTVKNYNYVSLSSSRVDVLAGKTKAINVNLCGGSYYSTSISGAGCSYSLNHVLGSTYALNIKGTNVGTTKITIYLLNGNKRVLDSKTVVINTSRNASVNPSSSSFSVDIGSSKAISFSVKNAYGNPYFVFALSNSNCVAKWSDSQLIITGKTAGSTTITVKLYDSSKNYLGSTSISVTIKKNPKLTPSVSKVDLIPAQTKKVNIKLTGYDSGVRVKYSISNKSVCGTAWSSNWSNNSLNLTLYGYRQGNTVVKVFLYNTSGTYLTETSITVSVTGMPSIGTSANIFSVNMGAQGTFSVTAQNVASSYKLSYKVSGTAFSCSWVRLVGKNYVFIVKGSKEGTGSITFTLKSEDGTVLATKTVSVKINWVENPQISVDKSTVSFTEGGSALLNVSCTGTKKQFMLFLSYSGKTGEPKLNMNMNKINKSTESITFSCSSCYSKTVTVEMIEASTGKTLTSKSVQIEVTPNTAEFNNLTYGTTNYSSNIPLSTFRYMYDTEGKLTASTLAKSMYHNYHKAGGVCYGFACTSMLFRNRTVSTSSFGASSISSINNVDKFKNSTLNISARRFIEGMYIMQFSSIGNRIYNMQQMVNLVKNGNRLLVCILQGNSGHALVAYKFDSARNRLYVYDCNDTTERRFIQLNTNSNGEYSSWSFKPLGWSGGRSTIFYQTMSNVNSMWNGRANYSYKNVFNTLFTNSTNFNITDVEGNVVATYSNGNLSTSSEDIYEICPIGYLEDNAQNEDENEINKAIVLPTKFYVINNYDTELDSFEAKMVNYDYGVSVSTDSEQISFGVDDSCDLCNTSITMSKGESYDITLLSSKDGEQDIHIEGQAMKDNLELGFAMEEGQLTQINGENASISVDGEPENFVTIEAVASEGGTITPNGSMNALLGSDLDFEIIPNEGYCIADVFVNGESVGATAEYSIFGIGEDTTIEARFKRISLTVDGINVLKNDNIDVSWNPLPIAEGYEVYRSIAGGAWSKIAEVSGDVLDYTDSQVQSNFTEYSYSVNAYSYFDGEKVYGKFDEIGSRIDDATISLAVSKTPKKTTYSLNETLELDGLELELTYNNNSKETITSGFTCSPTVFSTSGQQTITVSYGGKTATFVVTVNEPVRGRVKSVSVNDLSINYKNSGNINPNIEIDDGVNYSVTYSSSNSSVASVSSNGTVYGGKKGNATITCIVTDEYGNSISDNCQINVSYTWWQWIIKIVLFGWLWY